MMPCLPLYATAALRTLEARHAVPGAHALMERAGLAAWHAVLRHWPQAQRLVVVCGSGDNGGDGYVLARHARLGGREVTVLAVAPASPACMAMAQAYRDVGGRVLADDAPLPEADLIVDALLGIGLQAAPRAPVDCLIAAINAHPAPVLAIDVPSGVDADRGGVAGVAVIADRTLQCLGAHPGLYTGQALDHVGMLETATLDIDTAAALAPPIAAAAVRVGAEALAGWWPRRARDAHKGRYGHVLCIGGDDGMAGAILLAGEAALRCGSGVVRLATGASAAQASLTRRPELMAQVCDDGGALRMPLAKATTVLVGPGLGLRPWGRALFAQARQAAQPTVVDADALTLLAADPAPWPNAVLTPHPGEAARLLGTDIGDVQHDRYAAAAALAARFGCVVVLKGAGTLVAAPAATTRVIAAGNPGMASAGMGDVLAGVVAAALAQGLAPFEAATAAALLHAQAGDRAAAQSGERGLLAGDLLPWLQRGANPERCDA